MAVLAVLLAGCESTTYLDDDTQLTREDLEALKARAAPPEPPGVDAMAEPDAPPIPDFAPVLAAPSPPTVADTRRVSISVTDTTPLRDVLIELARQGGIDLELDPSVRGGVIFTANDSPLRRVIERLADLAGLRYTFRDNVLRIEVDRPVTRTYRLNVLNQVRAGATSIETSTDVFSAVAGSSAGGGNASTSSVTTESSSDFWAETTQNLGILLATGDADRQARQAALEAGDVRREQDAPPQPPDTPADQGGDGGLGDTLNQLQTAAQQVETGQGAAATGAGAGAGSDGQDGGGFQPSFFTVNRAAGLITVTTTERQHEQVADFLERVQDAVSSQVLIEAKIIEVTLSEEFRNGINWQGIGPQDVLDPVGTVTANLASSVVQGDRTNATLEVTGVINDPNFQGLLQLVDSFGSVRTLSSPRVTVLNNQPAVLKVAENEVYFTLEIDREIDEDTNVETRTFTSTVNTVPIGLIMTVQPTIDPQQGQISMGLRPSISRITRNVEDPAVALQIADINATSGSDLNVSSSVPVVEVRELDSVVNIRDGQTVVMGGLMQERAVNDEERIPGVADIPLVGNLARQRGRQTEVIELVIFLRATILNPGDSGVMPADIDLYNRYTPDPRPLGF